MIKIRKSLLIVIIAFFGCDNADKDGILCAYYSTSISFSILNDQDEDLLNPENQNHLDVSKMKLFYVVNGVKQELYKLKLNDARGFKIYKEENRNTYKIVIFLNYADKLDKTITYVQWNDTDTDILESTFNRTNCSTVTKQVWLNGQLVWDWTINDGIDPVVIRK
jgi:hypothetical protein